MPRAPARGQFIGQCVRYLNFQHELTTIFERRPTRCATGSTARSLASDRRPTRGRRTPPPKSKSKRPPCQCLRHTHGSPIRDVARKSSPTPKGFRPTAQSCRFELSLRRLPDLKVMFPRHVLPIDARRPAVGQIDRVDDSCAPQAARRRSVHCARRRDQQLDSPAAR